MSKNNIQNFTHWKEIVFSLISGFLLLGINQYVSIWKQGIIYPMVLMIVFLLLTWDVYRKRFKVQNQHLLLAGILFWLSWRSILWLFNSREIPSFTYLLGLSVKGIAFIQFFWLPFILLGIVIIIVFLKYRLLQLLFSHRFSKKWLYFVPLVFVICLTSWYMEYKQVYNSCIGIPYIMPGDPCSLRFESGFWGYIVIVFLLLIVPIIITLNLSKQYGLLSSLLIVGFVPVWAEILLFPAQIFGRHYLELLRVSADLIEFKMPTMLYISTNFPLLGFFIIVPIGLLCIIGENRQRWWLVLSSASIFIILYVLLTQELHKLSLSIEDLTFGYLIFGLFICELWLPLVIFSLLCTLKEN